MQEAEAIEDEFEVFASPFDLLSLGSVLALLFLPLFGAHLKPAPFVGLFLFTQLGRPLAGFAGELLIGSLDGAEGVLVHSLAEVLVSGVADEDAG